MAQKPASLPSWCTQNPTNIVKPAEAQVETGWTANERPAAEVMNWLQSTTASWLAYLDESQSTAVLASTLDPSVRLLGGGVWSWALGSTKLTWAETAYVAYPGVSDATNTIAAGNAVLPAGYIAYVVTNEPFTTLATTSNGSSTLTNVAYADVVQAGWSVTGPGIPANTTVSQLNPDGTSIVLSNAATANGTGVSLTFAGSGALTVQTASMASYTPAQNSVIIARATDQTCYVGTGTGQMRLHDGEARGLLEPGYVGVQRAPAGAAIAAGQAVYLSGSSDSGRTSGQLYVADASGSVKARAYPLGVAITAHAQGETTQVATGGLVGGYSGLTVGAAYYLDPANPGAITTSRPTQSGALVVPMGLAVSTNQLYLKPAAGASVTQNPTDLSLSGGLTANAVVAGVINGNSVVSGNGFRQQVYMGSITASPPSGQSSYTVSGTFGYGAVDGASGLALKAAGFWSPGNAGSMLNLQVAATTGSGSFNTSNWQITVYIVKNSGGSSSTGDILYRATNTFFTTGSYNAVFFPANKGQYTFSAFDLLYVQITGPTQTAGRISLNCHMTVEMGA